MLYKALIFTFILIFMPKINAKPRVIVLGFDGADPHLINKWIDKLPHIKKLKEIGIVQPLKTTNPSHSPVAWATFATGNNPGKHRVFGFLKRTIGKYKPEYAVIKATFFPLLSLWQRIGVAIIMGVLFFIIICYFLKKIKKKNYFKIAMILGVLFGSLTLYPLLYYIPKNLAYPISLKKGASFWSIAAENGIKTDVVMAPIAFPAEKVVNGHLLCGFGVPDLLKTNGTWNVYNSKTKQITSTETGGWERPLMHGKKNEYHADIVGPNNVFIDEEYEKWKQTLQHEYNINRIKKIRNYMVELQNKRSLRVKMLVKKITKKELEISIDNQKEKIKIGNWSGWFYLKFIMNPFVSVYGAVRIYVSSVDPNINIYVTPIQFVPKNSPTNVKLSYPPDFAKEVQEKVGMFPTLGWAAATNALKDEMISEEAFSKDLYNIIEARKKIFKHMLNEEQELLVSVFYFIDRASHMYWRFIDSEHVRYKKDSEIKLLEMYKEMDSLIGETYRKLKNNDILLVVSDHGFSSFRWQVNINTWLLKNGYLFLKNGTQTENVQVRNLFERTKLLEDIDWSKTRAYSIGLGKIFINLKNREPKGIVSSNQYLNLRQEIANKLKNFTHLGKAVVFQTYMQEQAFVGPYSKEAADIVIGFNKNYRVSWQTSLGGVPSKIIEPNKQKWSGDHCSVDPSFVPGVFMCNKKIIVENIHLQDIAPSILKLFSIQNKMDGVAFEMHKK